MTFMKKTLTICALSLAAALSTYAQSTVVFANVGTTLIKLQSGAGAPVGGTYQIELLYAPQGTPDVAFDDRAPTAIRIGTPVGISPIAGRFSGGARTSPSTTAGGGVARWQVRAWEAAYGSSYSDVYLKNAGGNVGKSAIMDIKGGDPTVTPAVTATPIVGNGFTGFTVTPVPEPSVIGLGLLGAGTLLLLRRRK